MPTGNMLDSAAELTLSVNINGAAGIMGACNEAPMPDIAKPDTARPDTVRSVAELPVTASPPSAPAHDPNYIVEVGGQRVSRFCSLTAALSAGLTLKGQNAGAQVKVYEA